MPIVKLDDVPVVLTDVRPLAGAERTARHQRLRRQRLLRRCTDDDIDMRARTSPSRARRRSTSSSQDAPCFTIDGVAHEVRRRHGHGRARSGRRCARSARSRTGRASVCIGAQPGTGDEGYGACVVPA